MPPLALLALQLTSSFVVFGLFANLVVAPRLRLLPRNEALLWLLWPHTLRYVPVALFAPGQTAPEISPVVLRTIAYGDFASASLALVAIAALHAGGTSVLAWVWAFAVVSTLDIVLALALGLGSSIYEHALGVAWYVLTLFVPLICTSQFMVASALVRTPRRPLGAQGAA